MPLRPLWRQSNDSFWLLSCWCPQKVFISNLRCVRILVILPIPFMNSELNAKYHLAFKLLFSSHNDVCVWLEFKAVTTITNGWVDLLVALMLSLADKFWCLLVSPVVTCLYTLPWLNVNLNRHWSRLRQRNSSPCETISCGLRSTKRFMAIMKLCRIVTAYI